MTFNICTGKVINLREIIKTLDEYFGYNLETFRDEGLVRKNEIPIIGGDPAKLNALARLSGVQLPEFTFVETIDRMMA